MWHSELWIVPLVVLLLTTFVHASRDPERIYGQIKSSVFLSPPFFLQEGSVVEKYYYDIPFPRGHIALKSFDAEVVDEMGVPVPLYETYLHHWIAGPYYAEKGNHVNISSSEFTRNDGVCKNTLGQYFGLGSESRKTSYWVPGPYGIEVGNPTKIPSGYDERWMLNVHAIDTRMVKDRLGCTECKCSLYNVTKDEDGNSLKKDYAGGLQCCYDQSQCQLREGFKGGQVRKFYLRYTVKWVDWDKTVFPVKIYIFDVTDSGTNDHDNCKVEYQVDPCDQEGEGSGKCADSKKTRVVLPRGGDIVYGVGHQHSGGVGAALYGQDGRILCSSLPTYGDGKEAGNESGYIVAMSSCYPKPGSVQISDGELLTVESNYSSTRLHTGVMGLIYILVANPQPQPNSTLTDGQTQDKSIMHFLSNSQLATEVKKYWWALVLVGGMMAIITGIVGYSRRSGRGVYQSI